MSDEKRKELREMVLMMRELDTTGRAILSSNATVLLARQQCEGEKEQKQTA